MSSRVFQSVIVQMKEATDRMIGVIDADTGEEALYGDDFTVEDIIWTGPQPTLREMGAGVPSFINWYFLGKR